MKYTKLLFLSAIPMLIVIILGVALKAPWWQVLIAALVVDLATDLTIIWNIRRDNPVCKADDWWDQLPFNTLEEITGYSETDFDPEDGSQAFVDACDEWWYEKTEEQRLQIWKEYR